MRIWFEGDESNNAPDTLLVAHWYFVQSANAPIPPDTSTCIIRDYEYAESKIFDLANDTTLWKAGDSILNFILYRQVS